CSPLSSSPPPSLSLSHRPGDPRALHSFPTRRSSDLQQHAILVADLADAPEISRRGGHGPKGRADDGFGDEGHDGLRAKAQRPSRSEEHTSELQSRENLVCRLLLEKKKTKKRPRRELR